MIIHMYLKGQQITLYKPFCSLLSGASSKHQIDISPQYLLAHQIAAMQTHNTSPHHIVCAVQYAVVYTWKCVKLECEL
jgi:hypothetical protein